MENTAMQVEYVEHDGRFVEFTKRPLCWVVKGVSKLCPGNEKMIGE